LFSVDHHRTSHVEVPLRAWRLRDGRRKTGLQFTDDGADIT
jgi:hypothetical protein